MKNLKQLVPHTPCPERGTRFIISSNHIKQLNGEKELKCASSLARVAMPAGLLSTRGLCSPAEHLVAHVVPGATSAPLAWLCHLPGCLSVGQLR